MGKKHPKVVTWLSKLQRKSDNAWALWLYCKHVGKTPDELLTLKETATSKEAEYLLDKFVADAPYTNSLMVKVVISVKSFYKHNYCDLARACGQVSLIKKYPYRRHSKEELLKIYRACNNPRDRTLVTFVWSTAIARETVSKVKWSHLEPNWETQELPHLSLGSDVIKGHGIGKYHGVEQHTFLTPEAKRDLVEYKDWLERVKGLQLTPDSNIFLDVKKPYGALGYGSLTKVTCTLMRRSGVKFSWHDARRYVETALEEVKIHPNWARKIRGRKVKGEESPYSRPAIEQLRKVYAEAVPLLEFTQPTQLMELQKRQEASETITSKIIAGEPLNEEDRLNIKRFNLKVAERATRRTEHNGGQVDCTFEQIAEAQLLSYLQAGWSIVHKLSDGQLVVKR